MNGYGNASTALDYDRAGSGSGGRTKPLQPRHVGEFQAVSLDRVLLSPVDLHFLTHMPVPEEWRHKEWHVRNNIVHSDDTVACWDQVVEKTMKPKQSSSRSSES